MGEAEGLRPPPATASKVSACGVSEIRGIIVGVLRIRESPIFVNSHVGYRSAEPHPPSDKGVSQEAQELLWYSFC